MKIFLTMLLGLGLTFASANSITVLDVKYVLNFDKGCSELGNLPIRKDIVRVVNSNGGDMALLSKYKFDDGSTGARLLYIDDKGTEYHIFTYSDLKMCEETFKEVKK